MQDPERRPLDQLGPPWGFLLLLFLVHRWRPHCYPMTANFFVCQAARSHHATFAALTLVLSIHVIDDGRAESGARNLGGIFHLASKVVGDGFGSDGTIDALDDEVSSFVPPEVTEHHFA